MIRLGILVVVLTVAGIAMSYLNRKYVRPYQHKKHQEKLMLENRELDRQMYEITHPHPKKEKTQ